MNLIKILPLSKSRLDVLFEIYAEREDYLRNISNKLNMNPSLAFRILNKLYGAGFLIRRKIGKEIQYSINKNADFKLLTAILEEYHLERAVERSPNLKTAINLILNNKDLINSSEKIYLFGSYAAGNFTKKSDIDILFVNEDKKLVSKTCREVSVILGKDINPIIYTKDKFNSDLFKGEPFLNSIVNNVRNRAIIK